MVIIMIIMVTIPMAMSALVLVIFGMHGITMAGNNDHRVMVVVMVPILMVT